jgi:putative adenylate-forming enzyme
VIEIYQASEGQIASACSHGHLHINEDLVFIELFDAQGNRIEKTHQVGHKMVLTNLINFAQPLIRYEMNDMIVLDDPCPCGSHFRRIEKILGRSDDNIYFYDDKGQPKIVYSDLFSRWIITTSDLIREFQVVQHQVSHLEITLDLLGKFDVNILKTRIDQELKALGLSGTYTFIIDALELPKHTNKFKRFISQLKKE